MGRHATVFCSFSHRHGRHPAALTSPSGGPARALGHSKHDPSANEDDGPSVDQAGESRAMVAMVARLGHVIYPFEARRQIGQWVSGSSSHLNSPDYRPHIEGLRAYAVMAVLLFHVGIPGFQGGFVGVDIFF